MITIPAATAAETGKNKDKVPSFDWVTSIPADQNVTGLPVNDKGVVTLSVQGDSFTVEQFETYAEVRSLAGEHYEQWVLDNANISYRSHQINQRRIATKGLTLAPADVLAFVRNFTADAVAFFAPTVRTGGKKSSAAALIAEKVPNLDNMSADELRALILAVGGKLTKK